MVRLASYPRFKVSPANMEFGKNKGPWESRRGHVILSSVVGKTVPLHVAEFAQWSEKGP